MKKIPYAKTCVAAVAALALTGAAAPALANTYYLTLASDDTMFDVVDLDSVKDLGGDRKSAQTVVIYNGPAYDGTTKYALAVARYDCKNLTADSKLRQNFDASGNLIRNIPYQDADSDFEAVLPGSIMALELTAVCEGSGDSTLGFSRSYDSVQSLVAMLSGFYASRHPQ